MFKKVICLVVSIIVILSSFTMTVAASQDSFNPLQQSINTEKEKSLIFDKISKGVSDNELLTQSLIQDDYEPNDSLEQAYAMTSDSLSATIGNSEDIDVYSKSFSAGQEIALSLKNIPTNCDYDLALFDSTGNQLAVSENTGTTNELITGTISVADTYFVVVYPYSGYSDSSAYTLYAGDAVKTSDGYKQVDLSTINIYDTNTFYTSSFNLTNDYSIPSGAIVTDVYLSETSTGSYAGITKQVKADSTAWLTPNYSGWLYFEGQTVNVKQGWSVGIDVDYIYTPSTWTPHVNIYYTYDYIPY